MRSNSRALPHYCYGDPADVVERMELRDMGCKLCASHDVVLVVLFALILAISLSAVCLVLVVGVNFQGEV